MATTEAPLNSRTNWIDLAKGVAIVLVVFGHALRGTHEAGLVHNARLFWSIDDGVYLFHMPVFFFLSGLTFSGTRYRLWDFTRRLLQNIIKLLGGGEVNHAVSPAMYLTILYKPVSPFWFLYALALIQLAARIALPKVNSLIFFLLAALAFVFHFGTHIPWIVLDNCAEFAVYFALGCLLANWHPEARYSRAQEWLGLAAFLGLDLGCVALSVQYDSLAGRLVAFPLILALSVALSCVKTSTNRSVATLLLIGKRTMAIYCMHILITGTCRIVLVHLHVRAVVLHVLIGTFLGVLIPLLFAIAAERMGISGWLGFGVRFRRTEQRVLQPVRV
jgi:fucose 4-O-acetylase-like acetyltransferase